jgi:hypothetical protein
VSVSIGCERVSALRAVELKIQPCAKGTHGKILRNIPTPDPLVAKGATSFALQTSIARLPFGFQFGTIRVNSVISGKVLALLSGRIRDTEGSNTGPDREMQD